jgi:condensin complex subunit 2
LDAISQKFISPSLRDFAFGNREVSLDDLTFMESAIPDVGGESEDDDTWEAARTVMATEPGVEPSTAPMDAVDFFTGDQAVADDFDPGFSGGDPMNMDMGMGMGMDPVPEDGSPPPDAEQLSQDATDTTEAFNPRRLPNEKELILAMTEEEGSGMMDYFDQTFLKNWAGPEHWKLRKVVRKGIEIVSFALPVLIQVRSSQYNRILQQTKAREEGSFPNRLHNAFEQ